MLVIDTLIQAIDRKQSPIVVGLDPVIEHIPDTIKDQAIASYGNTMQGVAEAIYLFNQALLNILHPVIPAVKLQMACYELYGQWGIDAFQRTVVLAKSLDLMVIDDSKRNDIGSSAALYAKGHLGHALLFNSEEREIKPDFLTINPYLGDDSISPFVKECLDHNKGLFILARTSNPSASQYQEALIDNIPLYLKIARDIQFLSEGHTGERGYSSFGAVVGATWPRELSQLREEMPSVYFLVPGYGAQGAGADDVAHAFNADGYGALINSSRAIIFAYRSTQASGQEWDPSQFAEASLEAVMQMRNELLRSLRQAGRLPKNW